jgi:hypothetical protein
MRRASMPKSQKCAHWLVSTTVGFSELRCKDMDIFRVNCDQLLTINLMA